MDQICPKWIKHDQIGFPRQSKNVAIKSCHIYRKDKNGCFVFDFFLDQICPKWIKLDQTGFPHQSKNITKNKNGHLIFDFFGSDMSKMDQA